MQRYYPILREFNIQSPGRATDAGLGRLSECEKCEVVEELNGIYELELTYPLSGRHAHEIEPYMMLQVPTTMEQLKDPLKWQYFVIYKISKSLGSPLMTINAFHVSYLLKYMPQGPAVDDETEVHFAETLDRYVGLDYNNPSCTPYTMARYGMATLENITFNITHSINKWLWKMVYARRSIRQNIAGNEGSVIDQKGYGEIIIDNLNIRVVDRRGSKKPFDIKYGKNMTALSFEVDYSDAYVGVIPYWMKEPEESGKSMDEMYYDPVNEPIEGHNFNDNAIVWTDKKDVYPFNPVMYYDCSEKSENRPSSAWLRDRASSYITQNGVGEPKISINTSFEVLSRYVEYNGLTIADIELGDTVRVIHEQWNLDIEARIKKITFDVIKGVPIDTEIGNSKVKLADLFRRK